MYALSTHLGNEWKKEKNELDNNVNFHIIEFVLCGETWTNWHIQSNDGTTCIDALLMCLLHFSKYNIFH